MDLLAGNPYVGIYIIGFLFMIVGALVSNRLKNKMKKYSQIGIRSGLSGRQVAEKMLYDSGINDVKVVEGQGFLTDHYNPITKTVSLSPEIYRNPSIAAAAVAAHEVGHAVQHHTGYSWLQMRSKMVPVVKFSGMAVQWVLLGGILLINVFPQLLLAGIALFAVTTLFSVVTLPVEVDATRRGLAWLETAGITYGQEHEMAKDGLKWAAYTYFVAALQSIATLLYYVMIYLRRR